MLICFKSVSLTSESALFKLYCFLHCIESIVCITGHAGFSLETTIITLSAFFFANFHFTPTLRHPENSEYSSAWNPKELHWKS